MTEFPFPVDEAYARKHNEFFRDASRLQIAAGVLAAVLLVVIGVAYAVLGTSWVFYALAISLGTFAALCLIVIPVLPRTMGDPKEYYGMYSLVPAVVAEVNPRDVVLLSLVDASIEPEARTSRTYLQPALAARTVTSIPGVPREVGARVPSMAVTGVRRMGKKATYEEISPMPVAWGTGDERVWRDAEAAIPAKHWAAVEKFIPRLGDVRATRRDLLMLQEGEV